MLNSNKGGSLHIGLHSSGRVEGIRISHDERDGFRSGIREIFLFSNIFLSFIDCRLIIARSRRRIPAENISDTPSKSC